MKKDINEITTEKLAEIEQLIAEFKAKLSIGLSDSEHFMKMTEIENLWSQLRLDTNAVYGDMLKDIISSTDESVLISKKKLNIKPKM